MTRQLRKTKVEFIGAESPIWLGQNVRYLKNVESSSVFIGFLIELDNDRVPIDSARPKFSAAPRSLVRERTKNAATTRGALHVHLLAVRKRKVAEMYAYARSAGALDGEHNCLRAI